MLSLELMLLASGSPNPTQDAPGRPEWRLAETEGITKDCQYMFRPAPVHANPVGDANDDIDDSSSENECISLPGGEETDDNDADEQWTATVMANLAKLEQRAGDNDDISSLKTPELRVSRALEKKRTTTKTG